MVVTGVTGLAFDCWADVLGAPEAAPPVLVFEGVAFDATVALARVRTARTVVVAATVDPERAETRATDAVVPQDLPAEWALSRALMIPSMRAPAPIGPGG
jgi:hypothetical protein